VRIGGTRITRDPAQADGWNYGPENKSVTFFGPTCDQLKAEKKPVEITFGCPGQTPL